MNDVLKAIVASLSKIFFTLCGSIAAILEPKIPFVLVCTLAVLFDAFTAWSLSRRVKKKFPGRTDGKFKSEHFGRVVVTLAKIYALIVLAAFMESVIFEDLPVKLVHIVSGAVCFWQVWSMLENESSCNEAKWARIAQRIMVDKTERHFDIDLHELRPKDEDNHEKAGSGQEGGDNGKV